MVGLLDLPLEVREPILIEVILDTTQEPPDDPLSAKNSEGYKVVKISGINTNPWSHIHHKRLQRHSMPLLHVNQQIRDEVIDLMPRKFRQRVDDAKLDFLFVEEINRHLWGTWLSAPFPTNNLNTLHAEIRNFQLLEAFTRRLHPIPDDGQDCKLWVNPHCADNLLKFLANFLQLRKGGASIHNTQINQGASGSQTASRTIQILAINIPFELDQQDSLETRVRCLSCTSAKPDVSSNGFYLRIPSGKRAVLVFAQSLHKQLLGFFETPPTAWTREKFPRIIFEAIGTIHLKVAGRLFASMDLSEILAKIPGIEEWNENGVSRSEFFQWKRLAEERRKTAGFTMVKSSAQESELVGAAGVIAGLLSKRAQSLVREGVTFSEDVAPSARPPAVDERVAFTGKAVFVQEDGSSLAGNATFYQTTSSHIWPGRSPRWWSGQSFPYSLQIHRVEKRVKDQPEEGEIVLFKDESILFGERWIETTITSGEATFYGPAEEGRTEQSGATEVDSPREGDRRENSGA